MCAHRRQHGPATGEVIRLGCQHRFPGVRVGDMVAADVAAAEQAATVEERGAHELDEGGGPDEVDHKR